MNKLARRLYQTLNEYCVLLRLPTTLPVQKLLSTNVKSMNNVKHLAAFDFDNTIIADNSDTVVRNLLPPPLFPKHIRNGWTKYMRSVFELLHSNGINETTIEQAVVQIAPIDGMCELIKELSQNLNFDVIIISDSNSYFINSWLKRHQLQNNIRRVFTNPAEFVDGLLEIQMYHIQDWCTLSEKNLCKGHILEEFIASQKTSGVVYDRVVYVGDGRNDFCPVLRLKDGDLAFCRAGFKCAELVKDSLENKPVENQLHEIRANVHMWYTGFDVLNAIKQILKS